MVTRVITYIFNLLCFVDLFARPLAPIYFTLIELNHYSVDPEVMHLYSHSPGSHAYLTETHTCAFFLYHPQKQINTSVLNEAKKPRTL